MRCRKHRFKFRTSYVTYGGIHRYFFDCEECGVVTGINVDKFWGRG